MCAFTSSPFFPKQFTVRFYLRKKELATLTGRAPELCGCWALWPGSVSGPCPPLVLVLAAPLNSVAGRHRYLFGHTPLQ